MPEVLRHVDGNALGGLLIEVFGREMTAVRQRCGQCGSVREFGALRAYTRGPGDVLRCPDCDTVLVVCVRIAGRHRVALPSVGWLEM
jgi:hypothetical protein